ncbi:hypothetical protein EDEG_00836 [Edhazardia aedis USNM 41457]|uniref:60S ribosomal protein L3 n=1 Tax=Edhazardia aedis (strain USNM 41457) TaxID=1003232 RepID=J9DR82_EDHAE|nr:hypothetical protein EDEG_00836 [Edhazardia aedis USNM 41457]|eukprot:EJW05055.1 hypothetical protein EDEG_00836 [Edhazardia aedis USNM 41457]
MSCRKYEAPRHGSLAYCPRKRANSVKQSLRAFPKDKGGECHLTATIGYKTGMSHIIRTSERQRPTQKKQKATTHEVFDAVTFIECPPVIIFGIVGYKKTITGLKVHSRLFAKNLSDGVLRAYNRRHTLKVNSASNPNTTVSTKNPLDFYVRKYDDENEIENEIKNLKKCDSIRVLIQSQTEKIRTLNTKKSHVMEVQVNGGKNVCEKVDWALENMEKEIPIKQVFQDQEIIDIIAVTKGKGFQGCTKRFGTRILPRKTNKGLRKVACIGAWHPSRVMWTVPRAGQMGFHRRTEINKRIYKIGNGTELAKTEFDLTPKTINPVGGFKHYGNIQNDYLMIKGSVGGPRKRVVTLRKSLFTKFSSLNTENISIKFIDTSSKMGSGRFQTNEEKAAYYGITKKKVTEVAERN